MVRFFSSANYSLVASPKSPTLISIASLRKMLPSLRSRWMTRFECMYSIEEISWCMKYRVYLGVSFLRFFTISLMVLILQIQYLVLAEFQNDIHELGVLEYTIKFDDVTMMQGFMDFDFREELRDKNGEVLFVWLYFFGECFYRWLWLHGGFWFRDWLLHSIWQIHL